MPSLTPELAPELAPELPSKLAPDRLAADIAANGYATRRLLSAEMCLDLSALYGEKNRFRKRIVMEHHAYGQGEYQ